MPNIRETADAAASTVTTYALGVGQTVQGTVTTQTDHDWYRVNLVAGQTYTFAMIGTGVTNDLEDTFLQLRNNAGTVIASNDDGGPALSSSLTFTASTSGTYYIDAGAYSDGGQYGLSMTTGTLALFDEMMGAAALLTPDASWGTAPGQAANVTWAVRATFTNSTDASGNAAPFSQLTASEIATVRRVMSYFSDAADITFTQVNPGGTSNNATMLISNYTSNDDGAGAYAIYPGSASAASASGDVRLNTTSINTSSQPTGSYSFFAIMHELGHAVGLAHPGDYNAGPGVSITYADFAQFQRDTHQYTVMSYFDEENTTTSYGSYPDTLMLYDILALQQLYGTNTSARTGNTIYGFGSNAGTVYDFSQNTDPVLCIWDAGGTDTLNASGFSQAQRINLTAGTFSSIGGLTNNVSIAFGAVIENANGGRGNDVIIGNAGANILNGAGGTDSMLGLGGNDIYYVDNVRDIIQEVAGQGTMDRVLASVSFTLAADDNIEYLATTSGAGTAPISLTGNALAQIIVGNAGSNVLNGGSGRDILRGLGGADTFVFNTALGAGNIDTLDDFTSADVIRLENAIFTGLAGLGAMSAAQFVANTTGVASNASQRIVYETDTGNLYYDSNGNAAGGSVLFARLDAGLVPTSADFFIV